MSVDVQSYMAERARAVDAALARRCSKYLEEAEKRIELLTKDEGGLLKTEPFEWDKDGQG